jgi:AcrR family transcriptional regulator
METTARKSSRKAGARQPGASLQTAYIEHVLNNGTPPVSIFKFCADQGITEDEFYTHFGSFEGLERAIWKGFIERTTSRLKADESFVTFSAREKVLAFYYTLFEEFRSSRSYILVQLSHYKKPELVPGFLKDFKSEYETFIESILAAGRTNREVARRPYLEKGYPKIFWLHMGFLLIFWKDDDSAAFEKTDAAIEKSVNLAFDLIGAGALDSAFDFAKFLYQTKLK